ncbi:DUF4349 domain-containing protein [Flavobacterium silvaticum]|uniref:DUF4349 domain-containing protein n=1 Tax=Flavobacterium silvaticum TaxID=1852020 RepID=A0A972FP03_9FLAO|nr:DUF4349 domain-containing protein [Flavobacterium silvaticum]NMH28765.1 DUF4349 domain-containing protein [Flavobacterium silvaticum]
MKSISLFAAMVLVAVASSCKQSDFSKSEEAVSTTEESVSAEPAPTAKPVQGRKFVRTADMRFKVKDVAKSTFEVEKSVNRFGGFVVETNLQSNENGTETAKLSQDSIVETKRFTVTNDMIIRVPNARLDSLLTTVQSQVGYLNHRVIKAEDVQLKMLANQMAQQRQQKYNARMENGIDSKGRKLKDVVDAEDRLTTKNEEADSAKIQNLDLEDKVAYSTVSLQLYQNETVLREVLANPESLTYKTSFGTQVTDSLLFGWNILQGLITFFLRFWTIWLIGLLVFFILTRRTKKIALK